MNNSIAISFNNGRSSSSNPEYWLKLELVEEKDTATLGETAELLDDLYEINPCEEEAPVGQVIVQEEKPEPLTQEDFIEIVKRQFNLNLCNTNLNNDYIAKIKVFKSHANIPYKLTLDNGKIISTTFKQESITENLTVENSTSVSLSYPLRGNLTHNLNNYVPIIKNANVPTIKIDGSTLSWDIPITASFTVSYLTEYDLVEIQVNATDEDEMGECLVLGFYHGLVEELQITPPDVDEDGSEIYRSKYCGKSKLDINNTDQATCYETVTKIYRCQCSGEKAYDTIEYVNVTCPENIRCPRDFNTTINNGVASCSINLGFRTVEGGYVDCGETTGDINDPEFYKQTCCEYPSVTLPKCDVYYEKNLGGKGLSAEKQNEYIAQYGSKLKFVAVSPKDGDCGKTKYNQVKNQKNCCDEAVPITFDDDATTDVLPHDSHIDVFVNGGRFPITFTTSSSDTSFLNGGRTITVDSDGVTLFSNFDFCGHTQISVTDGCSVITFTIRSDQGEWIFDHVGCEFPGATGERTGAYYNSYYITYINGGTKVVDFQTVWDSYNIDEVAMRYFGAVLSSTGAPWNTCPGFNSYTCLGGGQEHSVHCACSAYAVQVGPRPLCLAPAYSILNPPPTEFCGVDTWMDGNVGYIGFSCRDGNYTGAAFARKRMGFKGHEQGPWVYKWRC